MRNRLAIAVLLMLLSCSSGETPTQPTTTPSEVNLRTGYEYREDTLARFRLLIEQEGWSLADPPRNEEGMLEAVHGPTGLIFVLVPVCSVTLEGRPSHTSFTMPFLMSKLEVTNALVERFDDAWVRPDLLRGRDDPAPMTDAEARHFLGLWFGRDAATQLRLPHVDEWHAGNDTGSLRPNPVWKTANERLGKEIWVRGSRYQLQHWYWVGDDPELSFRPAADLPNLDDADGD